MIATASFEIRDLIIFRCPQCASVIRSTDYGPECYQDEFQRCESCDAEYTTERLLVDFLTRENWPAQAQVLIFFRAMGFHLKLLNNTVNEIDFGEALQSEDELVEVHILENSEHIFFQATAHESNAKPIARKRNVYVAAPGSLKVLEIPVQILFQTPGDDQEMKTIWYRIFNAYATKTQSGFLYYTHALLEKCLVDYFSRKGGVVPYKFQSLIKQFTQKNQGNLAIENCLSAILASRDLRNSFTHTSRSTSDVDDSIVLARLIQIFQIFEADRLGRKSI